MDLFLSRAVNLRLQPITSKKLLLKRKKHHQTGIKACRTIIIPIFVFRKQDFIHYWNGRVAWVYHNCVELASSRSFTNRVQETTSTQLVWHTLVVHTINPSDNLGQLRGMLNLSIFFWYCRYQLQFKPEDFQATMIEEKAWFSHLNFHSFFSGANKNCRPSCWKHLGQFWMTSLGGQTESPHFRAGGPVLAIGTRSS